MNFLLEAAAQLLEEGGYAAATTTAVAERAGVSIGSFYQYFASREDLLRELVRRHGQSLHPFLQDAGERLLAGGESPVAVLQDLTRSLVAAHRDRPRLMAVLEQELADVKAPDTAQWQADLSARSSHLLASCLSGDPETRLANAWVAVLLISSVARNLGHTPLEGLDPARALEAVDRVLAALFESC